MLPYRFGNVKSMANYKHWTLWQPSVHRFPFFWALGESSWHWKDERFVRAPERLNFAGQYAKVRARFSSRPIGFDDRINTGLYFRGHLHPLVSTPVDSEATATGTHTTVDALQHSSSNADLYSAIIRRRLPQRPECAPTRLLEGDGGLGEACGGPPLSCGSSGGGCTSGRS
jgi:hypothetical protein